MQGIRYIGQLRTAQSSVAHARHAALTVPMAITITTQSLSKFGGYVKSITPSFTDFIKHINFVLTWKEVGAIMGRRGGLQAAANMTPEQRKARAIKAVRARWDKAQSKRIETAVDEGKSVTE